MAQAVPSEVFHFRLIYGVIEPVPKRIRSERFTGSRDEYLGRPSRNQLLSLESGNGSRVERNHPRFAILRLKQVQAPSLQIYLLPIQVKLFRLSHPRVQRNLEFIEILLRLLHGLNHIP